MAVTSATDDSPPGNRADTPSVGQSASRRGGAWLRQHLGGIPSWLQTAVVIAALVVGYVQLREAKRAMQSSAAAAVYQAQREVAGLIDPKMYPYFFANRPTNDRDVYEVAGALLDHFEHLRVQIRIGAFPADPDGWASYMRRSFTTAPVLCERLEKEIQDYGGSGPGTLWDTYAKQACD